ncbi:MAG: hypothetical protein LBN30_00025 [Oscillospiraceae bacterium]|nr:hypothetical protein [Oscillospiraceae bacterium]
MAKAGMRRPNPKQPHGTESNKKAKFPKNDVPPVPEVRGKDKHDAANGAWADAWDDATTAGGVMLTTSEVLDFAAGEDN